MSLYSYYLATLDEEFLNYLIIEWNIPYNLYGKETLYNNYEELL